MAKEHCYHNKLLFVGVESVSWRLRVVVANDQFAAVHPHWPLKALRTLLSHNFECSMEYKTTRTALLQLIQCPKRRNVNTYATSKCRVSSLELTRCVLSDQSSVFDLTRALEDSTLAITKTLRHLVLHLGRHTVSITDELLTAFLSMLQVNQRLRHVVLFVSNDQQTRFASRFRALNAHIPRPLSLSAKCAFLSVVRLTHNKAMSRLDSRVVSQIFSLAAETESRTVVFHVY